MCITKALSYFFLIFMTLQNLDYMAMKPIANRNIDIS